MKNVLGCLGILLLITLIAAIIGLAINDDETAKNEQKEQRTEQGEKEEQVAKEKEEQELAKKEAEQKAAEEARLKEEAEQKAKEESVRQKQAEQTTDEKAQALGLEAVIISRVVDGDTVELSDKRKIRLVGVNTPESTTRHEVYGKEASDYTTSELEGKKVWLQQDVSNKDRYNRYLRLIWISVPLNLMDESEIRSKMFNAQLVLNGYAQASTYPPDVTYSDYFVKFAREARSNGIGLWAYGENGTTKGDLDKNNSKPVAPKNKTTTAGSGKNEGSESYKNCTELRIVYPEGVPSTHPAYESKHDRDKDNWACEKAS
ncbi:thermonuclease family protein [Bacillus sp. REN16]|uniref:thermonuclease family protein n=1 Tax=Bacillus sp. REN16 TaxID=2887296 RepID=UPI001E3306EC|nr:thermonuclease family protein [Bacillus sp. REN16]MCC3355702.1 thermonuclease family protein [Bacillus sp. REN16]